MERATSSPRDRLIRSDDVLAFRPDSPFARYVARRCVGLACTAMLLGLGLVGCGRETAGPPTTASEREQVTAKTDYSNAVDAVARRRWQFASVAIQQHLADHPDDAAGLELAGDIARERGHGTQAIGYYSKAVRQAAAPSVELLDKLGRSHMAAGKPWEALATLQTAVQLHPQHAALRNDFAGLAAALGQERLAGPHLRWHVERGSAGMSELIMLSDLERPQTDAAICEDALRRNPDDLRPRYPQTRDAAYKQDWPRVIGQLQAVVSQHPDFLPAQILYGRALLEQGRGDELPAWHANLPRVPESDPTYWLTVGGWAEQDGQTAAAAKAYGRAVGLDENSGEALTKLATTLARLDRLEESRRVANRARQIAALREAIAWARLAQGMTQNRVPEAPRVLADLLQAYQVNAAQEPVWQTPAGRVAETIDLSDLPSIVWQSGQPNDSPSTIPVTSEIRFASQAAERGLVHRCRFAADEPAAGLMIFESTVGSVATLDYDLDGWPDVLLSDSTGTPHQRDSQPNRIYRNEAGMFRDVTTATRGGDTGYAMGLTVGDYNSDGFVDMLVGNIGENRLYRNNGDGTFTDVSASVGLVGKQWTTSVLIADIDQDGHADLYTVNYCAGDGPYKQPCISEAIQEPRSCNPLAFPAEQDRVWQGQGDGTFKDRTSQWLSDTTSGRGLGIASGLFDDQPGMDLYVVNDMTPNQFWSASAANKSSDEPSRSEQVNATFRFNEQATLRGVAFNNRSLSQASMGMAVGDADQDGDIDFFLTHFSGDNNTYYEQVYPGIWTDRSVQADFVEPSMPMLGFGTEWIDADNDGQNELLVLNGNVDDYSHDDIPFAMPAQWFRRDVKTNSWQELPSEMLGEYFGKPHIGRALSVGDFNRDGRLDAVATHLLQPVELLINQTPTEHSSVRLFLTSTHGQRDAIGAQVQLRIGQQTRVAQLTAGDGFQCANERVVTIGIPADASELGLSVQWPGGEVETFGQLASGAYRIVEGQGQAFALEPAAAESPSP